MFKWYEDIEGNNLGIVVYGKVTRDDYQRFVPVLEKAIDDYGSINLLVKIASLEGIEPGAVWEDVKFDVKHLRDIKRMALVGDRKYEKWIKYMDPFVKTDSRYFDFADEHEAWQWISEGELPATERRVSAG